MTKRPYRRRQYLINKNFQLRYMAMICVALIVVSVFSTALMYFGIWGSVLDEFSNESVRYQLLTAARMTDYEFARRPFSERRFSTLALFKETDLLSQRQREIFNDILTRTNKRLAVKVGLIVALIAAWSIFITHRIAGPLYRFDQCFKQITSGDLTVRGRLRKGDEAGELMMSFNTMAESLDDSIKNLKKISPNINPPTIKEQVETELNHFRNS